MTQKKLKTKQRTLLKNENEHWELVRRKVNRLKLPFHVVGNGIKQNLKFSVLKARKIDTFSKYN